jgi:hypothetical protein
VGLLDLVTMPLTVWVILTQCVGSVLLLGMVKEILDDLFEYEEESN